jgi:dihydrofolate synthase/folylpolyglutamate synthase
MSHSLLDVAILEVGLGGRLDATNIIDADCAIITSIDIDHTEFLGRTASHWPREGRHHAHGAPGGRERPDGAAKRDRPRAVKLGPTCGALAMISIWGDKQQWNWAGRGRRYAGLAYPALRGANQLVNASGCWRHLRRCATLPVTAQAVRNGLAHGGVARALPDRARPAGLVLDVAHNPHSVAALTANLDAMGYFPVTHAVFGAMADKDWPPCWPRLAPWWTAGISPICPRPGPKVGAELQQKWNAVHMVAGGRKDVSSSVYPDPLQALQAAVEAADPADRIVVFGSFYTVGGVLVNGIPRLHAKHLGA